LKRNRSAFVETDCVWSESNATLIFNEFRTRELSTIDSYTPSVYERESKKHGKRYGVKTISLEDLLDKYDAPAEIDYLSIDTEGSEYDILSAFNFDKYRFRVITCEHNHAPQREKILSLLTKNGYVVKHRELSLFDDWYVRAEVQ
jgi:FkbM family methyltransferase